jgi:hypothetical protein
MRIHFHSSDDRFCGAVETQRRFTLDPNKVTCGDCKGRDTLTLSEDAKQYLGDRGYMDANGAVR